MGKALDRIISGAKGRVIVASFASHIHRMQQICDAAVKNGRKVADLYGALDGPEYRYRAPSRLPQHL